MYLHVLHVFLYILGEIVGFVKDPKNDNKQVICKLDYKLASESILKGVVTRSQYLEARLPENGGKLNKALKTSIVCKIYLEFTTFHR